MNSRIMAVVGFSRKGSRVRSRGAVKWLHRGVNVRGPISTGKPSFNYGITSMVVRKLLSDAFQRALVGASGTLEGSKVFCPV
jgi:hypothetical protein